VQPAEGGEAVVALVECVDPAAGAEGPAHALHHDVEAAMGDHAPE